MLAADNDASGLAAIEGTEAFYPLFIRPPLRGYGRTTPTGFSQRDPGLRPFEHTLHS